MQYLDLEREKSSYRNKKVGMVAAAVALLALVGIASTTSISSNAPANLAQTDLYDMIKIDDDKHIAADYYGRLWVSTMGQYSFSKRRGTKTNHQWELV